MLNNKISNTIKKLRFNKAWTQKKLAQKANLSQSTVCRSEINCYNIKFGYVVRILEILSDQNFDLFNEDFLLQDSQISVFIQSLKNNNRVWTLINYDARRTAAFFIRTINENYKKL